MTAKIEKIRRMQHIWETQVKPHVQGLMGKEDGQYAAMVLVAHGCEHAYKAIHNPKERNVMQESLESVLRLHDFLRVDSRNESTSPDATRHLKRIDAHKIRKFIVNSWKHEGMLKGEKTELINDPQRARSMDRVILSGFRDVKPLEIDDLEMDFDALDIAKQLVSGIDSAYSIFLDDSSPSEHEQWFSPAQCSTNKRCKRCKKELVPCEPCEEKLEFVGVKIRCMCDENSKSTREAIRWIRYCESNCAEPGYPKHLKDEHFLLSEQCLFSSVCREINELLIANLPEPVFSDSGAIVYAAGTYIEDEIKSIMRPLRAEVEKCLTQIDRRSTADAIHR